MLIYCICTQYLVGAPFALITASIRRGMEVISLWHCWGGMEAQVSLIDFIDSLWGSGQASLLANQAHGHWTSFWYLWQCGQVPSPAGKWNQHLHKACQQKEAWSALKFPGRWLCWLWTSENTAEQHQQMTWQPKSSLTVETSHWTSSNMDSVPLHSFSRLWDLDFQIKCKIYFHLKRGLWTTEQQSSFFLHSPGKTLLMLSLVQKWLGSPFPEDVWAWWLLMHWLQLQSSPCEALTSVWISFAWQYSQACSHPCCLCTFSYPNSSFQSTLHLICFDTALCKQPHLSEMTLCDLPSLWRVSMFAVFSIIVVSKNKIYPEFIL